MNAQNNNQDQFGNNASNNTDNNASNSQNMGQNNARNEVPDYSEKRKFDQPSAFKDSDYSN